MKFRLSSSWRIGPWVAPADTVIDTSADEVWSRRAKGKTIPFDAVPMDAEAYEAQLKAFPDAKHLLSGGWEDKTR
jgi:hypothetical protein